MALTARPATLGDAAFLLGLRNDPVTVAASRVQAAVTAHDHVAWLDGVLADPARRLMIVWEEDLHRNAVGTYRLDGVGTDRVEISLTVTMEYRGRGLARQVIELATRDAVRYGPEVLTAEIRRETVASFIPFFRNGFVITGWLDGGLLTLEVNAQEIIRRACWLCLAGKPHHTNAMGSIGGAEGRHPRYDLHVGEGGGLAECEAGDAWLAWEQARTARGR